MRFPFATRLLLRREGLDVRDEVFDLVGLELARLAPRDHARRGLAVRDAVAEVGVDVLPLRVGPGLRVLPVRGRVPRELHAAGSVGLVAGDALRSEDRL